ncbi:MAG: hypothetical protein LBJ75_03420 [Puniceicoccales bacterium]|nr:hypothetical protein [Puniceicoccales bacterium]
MALHKREILVRLIRMFNGQNFLENIGQISNEYGQDSKETAVCRALAIGILGLTLEGGAGKRVLQFL